jgi:hypothetical protein
MAYDIEALTAFAVEKAECGSATGAGAMLETILREG